MKRIALLPKIENKPAKKTLSRKERSRKLALWLLTGGTVRRMAVVCLLLLPGLALAEEHEYRPALTTLTVTAYCPCKKCCGKTDGITATGTRAHKGTCATDWRVFPPGTRLHIPGYGFAVAEDRGGAIKNAHIDVFFPTHKEALQWGLKTMQVAVWVKKANKEVGHD
ncbi:MAG: 3D domain-containing protein [Candidatus Thermoplasmatota archaeon]|nr:3D domain-containing protein [Candidatus Thermoplasmatota archaeon]